MDRATGAVVPRNAIFVIHPDQMRFLARGLAVGYGVGTHEYIPVRLAQRVYCCYVSVQSEKDILKALLTEHVHFSSCPGTACA
jgi:hypothetical protein